MSSAFNSSALGNSPSLNVQYHPKNSATDPNTREE
ncbi:hypothetical protein CCHR01_13173 [Colletotrichum chrysophilum]|uniref:Uncharacterized protein n=1 Tax=Colletotrichum chrysophilum TaxID=1836956 RepID=A0AAD9EDY5_9PEZI|nr:hypothetical protein CCHR01_13173 [Colletotrichum chrysophilum]